MAFCLSQRSARAKPGPRRGPPPPNPPGMVHFLKVGEFVEDQIVADENRGLDKPPVEGDGAAARAGSPAGTLIAHCYPRGGKLMKGSQLEDAGGDLFRRQPPQMPLYGRAQVTTGIRQAHQFGAEAYPAAFLGFEPDLLAAEENLGPRRPGPGPSRLGGLAEELALQPAYVLVQEALGLGDRAKR